LTCWPGIDHGSRVIRTVHDTVGTQSLDGKLETIGVEYDGVVIKLPKVLLGVPGSVNLRLLAHPIPVLPAPSNPGHKPAHVRQIKAEVRVAIEHAAEDQTGSSDGRVEWITNEVSKIEFLQPIAPTQTFCG